jgi:hypothetical protein
LSCQRFGSPQRVCEQPLSYSDQVGHSLFQGKIGLFRSFDATDTDHGYINHFLDTFS